MAQIIWLTKSGTIGTIAEDEYFEFQLDAYTNPASPLTYKIIAGQLPPGLQLISTGLIQGIPVIDLTLITQKSFTQIFTVRSTNGTGQIADRTFSVTINAIALPQIVPRNVSLGTYYSGYYLNLQLEATDPNPLGPLSWSLVSGTLPNGITLSSSGQLIGHIRPFIAASSSSQLNWSKAGWDSIPWDSPSANAQSHNYYFTVQVFDGSRTDETTYSIFVQLKTTLTADNTVLLVNMTGININITVDVNDMYTPFIVTLPGTLPTQRQQSNFAFQIVGEVLSNEALNYALVAPTLPTGLTLDPVSGWITGFIEPQYEVQKTYTFDVFCYVAVPTIQTVQWSPNTLYDIDVNATEIESGMAYTIASVGTDFTAIGAANNNVGTTFTATGPGTGNGSAVKILYLWATNYLGHNTLYIVNTTFMSGSTFNDSIGVTAYTSVSDPVTFTLTVMSDLNNTISWISPADLGSIDNGSVSEFSIVAVSELGKKLTYRIKYDDPLVVSQLPQGLILLPNGLITGRASFKYFSLDGGTTTFDNQTTNFDNLYQFTVNAFDETTFDSNTTTFDNNTTRLITVSADKTFTIRVNNFNKAPYENLYLKALLSKEQRLDVLDLLSNTHIFPDQLIYRAEDLWFGKTTDIKFLFAAGLAPNFASTYIAAMQYNHYTKSINLGNVKTAIALDANLNIKYEIVYVEVIDPETADGKSLPHSINRTSEVISQYDIPPFAVVYPNSLDNMFSNISAVGFTNKGALPDWMLDPQPNSGVLGFTRGVILAYTIPGASSLIASRLQKNNITFNNINFVVDRYELDQYLSHYYDITTQTFLPSAETTFDSNTTIFDGNATKFFNNRTVNAPVDTDMAFLGFTRNNIYQ